MMAEKKFEDGGVPFIDGLYPEAADAIVSWPCIVFQAFGLNFVRGVKLGLEHLATGAGVELVVPEDTTRTIPIE
jgi:hypothetical protein